MPYLDWSSRDVRVESRPHPKRDAELLLAFPETELLELVSEVERILAVPSAELKLTLPSGWTLYWKLRDSESRVLLAHPETDLWVVTLALEAALLSVVLERLRGLGTGASFRISELTPLGRVTNLELVLLRA